METEVSLLPAHPRVADYVTVLVALDGSRRAETAIEPARRLADAFGAELHVIAAGVPRDERWWYEHYLDEISRRVGASPHCVDGAHGDVASQVEAMADELEPSVVCLATHGRSRSAALLGSTFLDLARTGPAPLVAVGPEAIMPWTDRARRIVACVDGRPLSEQVLPLAGAWARRLDCRLSIATVVEPAPPPVIPAERLHTHHLTDPESYLDRLARLPALDGLDVDRRVILHPLSAHAGLIEHLRQEPAALVAATSRGRHGPTRALLGSEIARIIHHCPVPVLVQPTTHPDGNRRG